MGVTSRFDLTYHTREVAQPALAARNFERIF
jgi:hypothetical protein